MLSNLILLTCLNRYLLVLCYTIVTFSPHHHITKSVLLGLYIHKKRAPFQELFCGADGT